MGSSIEVLYQTLYYHNMTMKHYNWPRFFVPMGKGIRLSDQGFLPDPTDIHGLYHNPEIKPLEKLIDKSPLIILGEPGIGKTSSIEDGLKEFKPEFEDKLGNKILCKDLKGFSDEAIFLNRIFNDEELTTWKDSDYILLLVLDSLDECLLRIDTVRDLLAREFEQLPRDRLKLIIACRTYNWPTSFENQLQSLFGIETELPKYEVAPLRWNDIETALKVENIDTNEFFTFIRKNNLQPLAIKPITLIFLIKIFGDNPEINDISEIYRKGCLFLAAEPDDKRKDSTVDKIKGSLTSEQRMLVAARIAALCHFCNKIGVYKEESIEESIDILQAQELLGNNEKHNSYERSVDIKNVHETLQTGLFSSIGNKSFGFYHSSIQDFLAAFYLIHQLENIDGFDREKILNLISLKNLDQIEVIPKFYELTKWLILLKPDIFESYELRNPEIYLHLSENLLPDSRKEKIVVFIEKTSDANRLRDFSRNTEQFYSKLAYPGLSNRLKNIISDKSNNFVKRDMATDIAKACNLNSLKEEIEEIAYDENQEPNLRSSAILALENCGDVDSIGRLKELFNSDKWFGLDDEVKGAILYVIWPDNISLKEILNNIPEANRPNIYGLYQGFLFRFTKSFKKEDMLLALEWVTTLPDYHSTSPFIHNLAEDIIDQASLFFNDIEVRDEFIKALINRVKEGFYFQKELLSNFKNLVDDDEKRKIIIEEIINLVPANELWEFRDRNILIRPEDLKWVFEKVAIEHDDEKKENYYNIISFYRDYESSEYCSLIFEAIEKNPDLKDVFKPLLTCDLGSTSSESNKMFYQNKLRKENEALKQIREFEEFKESLDGRITNLLDDFESGKLEAWFNIDGLLILSATKDGQVIRDLTEPDVSRLENWPILQTETHNRITSNVGKFLESIFAPKIDDFLKNKVPISAFVGYRAFILLLLKDKNSLDNLSLKCWESWCPSLLSFNPNTINIHTKIRDSSDLHIQLLNKIYEKVPETFLNCLIELMKTENERHEDIYLLEKMPGIWNEEIKSRLVSILKHSALKLKSANKVLKYIFSKDIDSGFSIAKELLSIEYSSIQENTTISVASWLFLNGNPEDREFLFQLFEQNTALAENIFLNIGDITRGSEQSSLNFSTLSEEELQKTYYIIETIFPADEDPEYDGWLEPRHYIKDLKRSTLNILSSRGNESSIAAFTALQNAFPTDHLIKYFAYDTEKNILENSWQPFSPDDFNKHIENASSRIINTPQQLLNIIIELLKRLQKELKTSSDVDNLWNDRPRTPKDENHLSNYVKRFLEKELTENTVFINREVEVRTGQETDIHIDAGFDDESGMTHKFKVVIETKGAWNQGLLTSMEDQLFERYMKQNSITHGIYLVGWFLCEEWVDEDRKTKHRRRFDEMKEKLTTQAATLTKDEFYVEPFILDCSLL